MSSNDLEVLQNYYASLLIIQYQLPNAVATIKALIDTLMPINSSTGNLLLNDVRDAFNLDTAVGQQLDILGSTVGVNRYYNNFVDNSNYFGFFDTYSNDSGECKGYIDTDDSGTIPTAGIWIDYSNLLAFSAKLNDDDFRLLIKLKILKNTSNHSWQSLTEGLYNLFGNNLYIGTCGMMHMTYFANMPLSNVINAAASKKILPRPLGVTISGIVPILSEGIYFGFIDGDCLIPSQTYSNISSVNGQANIGGYIDTDDSGTVLTAGIVMDAETILRV